MDSSINKTLDVSVILVNYFTSSLLGELFESIKKFTTNVTYELIIVDNSCDDEEYKKLLSSRKEALIIRNDKNSGFGAANNLGSKHSSGKYLLFLNCDTILLNNAIYILKDFLDSNSDVGIVGPNIYTRDLKPHISFFRKEKNLKNISIGLMPSKKKKELFRNTTDNPIRIEGYISGACLMIRKDLFNKINGFDERIFMYSEESLLCYRARKEFGFELYNVPEAKIIHLEGASFQDISIKRSEMFIDGNYQYFKILFGEKIAIKYLKKKIRELRKRKIIYSVCLKKQKAKEANINLKCYKEKLNSIIK